MNIKRRVSISVPAAKLHPWQVDQPLPSLVETSVKLHVSIGKYWVSLYVLVCMVVCIVERIGMY